MIVDAMCRLSPQDIVLQFFAVRGLVGGAVVDLCGHDGDLVGEARAHLVGHDEDQVGVWNHLNNERSRSIGRCFSIIGIIGRCSLVILISPSLSLYLCVPICMLRTPQY